MNRYGRIFSVSLFGESHGPAVGVVIDGCPPGIAVSVTDFQEDLARRKPGAKGTTARMEEDIPQILSGVYNGATTGAPLTILFANQDAKPSDYEVLKDTPRPGHADSTAMKKYKGFADLRGGGHFSGRLTLPLVAAGVVAKKILNGISVEARLTEAGGSKEIEQTVGRALEENDSIGALVECRINNVPAGLGDPFFDSVESCLSHILFAIPGIKGVEFGDGFKAAGMKGSKFNDVIEDASGKTKTNHSGGINGGITNGNEIFFRVAVRPTASISKPQQTVNLKTGKTETIEIKGRHDCCIGLRVPVVVEAAAAIALADLFLIEKVNH